MAQPFGVGDVVGGRYRITHHVVTSADQDIVFQATDEFLDREVSILLASRSNAKQVATSAKELATGERDSAVQVLDLGLADERTYLISNQTDPNLLLDLVVPDAAPYVEPFFTDSLGQEIFGQSRVMEPETYEDDVEYYARLHDGLGEDTGTQPLEDEDGKPRRRRPAFLDKVSDSLNKRLGTDRDADRIPPAGAAAQQVDASQTAAVAAGAPGALTLQSDMELVEIGPEADSQETFEASTDPSAPFSARDGAGAAAGAAETEAPSAEEQDGEVVEVMPSVPMDTVAAQAAAPASEPASAEDFLAEGEEVVDDPPQEPVAEYDQRPAPAPAPADAAGLSGERESEALAGLKAMDPENSNEDAGREGGQGSLGTKEGASSFTGVISAVPPQARSSFPSSSGAEDAPEDEQLSSAAGSGAGAGADGDTGFQDEKPTPRRWLGVISLAAIIAVIAVSAFFALTGGEPDETAQEAPAEDEDAAEGADEGEGQAEGEEGAQQGEEQAEQDTPAPSVTEITRSVPDSTDLGSDNDVNLGNIHDGDTGTTWSPGSYGSAAFGGFASTMYLVVELEESAPVSAVTVNQDGETSGGTFDVLVNDQPSTEGAETVGDGSFEWSETTVELEEGAEGQYVLIAIDELPQHTPPPVAGLPYTLNLAQITVE